MKLHLLILLFLGLSWQTVSAQFQNKTYQMESIYLRNNRYVKNGIEYRMGLFGGKIEQEFVDKPLAAPVFKRFKNKRTAASILSIVGTTMLVGSLVSVANDDFETFIPLYLGGLIAATVSIPIGNRANNDLQQAIWLRNGEILR